MTIMKKIVFTGIILVLVMTFAVTCDSPAAEEVEYTDVVYSPDGSVTVYFDGVKVPVTKAQRAMTKDLAMMAYDYLEVIFINSAATPATARNKWELGQPAGINLGAAWRDGTTNYADLTKACLFAGKKSDKTLFGIGQIQTNATTVGTVNIGGSTESVTFFIRAILSGLRANSTTATPIDGLDGHGEDGTMASNRGVAFDSLGPAASSNGRFVTLGSVKYPLFQLDDTKKWVNLTYEFSIVGTVAAYTSFLDAAKVIGSTYPPLAQRRVPRFLDKGAYREPKTLVNSKTTVSIGTAADAATSPATNPPVVTPTPITAGGGFVTNFNGAKIPLAFVTNDITATGYFSVYIEIPVYMVSTATATNTDGTASVTWFIRTGHGSELFSIDDGASSAGCMLFGRGSTGTSDWLGIDWQWL